MPMARPSKSTTYVLTVRNRYDCVDTDTVRLTVHPQPSVDVWKDARYVQRRRERC
jgi:hypothetical protein